VPRNPKFPRLDLGLVPRNPKFPRLDLGVRVLDRVLSLFLRLFILLKRYVRSCQIHRTDTSERRWKLAGQNDAGKWMSGRDSGQTQVANGGNNTWMKIKLSSANAFFSLSPSYSYAFGAPQDPQTAYRALIGPWPLPELLISLPE
jgi:hypothetical protein